MYARQEINIKIGKKSPKEYMTDVVNQCNGGKVRYGGISDMNILLGNLEQNAIP